MLFEICISVNTTGKNFVTPLIAATMNGHIEVVKFLLNFPFGEKLNVNALSDFGTALMYAGSTGDIVIVRELLAHDADVNARDQRGRTALMMAALTGQYGVVDLLLYNGADINVKDERGMTALDKALYKGHKEVAQLLRDHGAIESSD